MKPVFRKEDGLLCVYTGRTCLTGRRLRLSRWLAPTSCAVGAVLECEGKHMFPSRTRSLCLQPRFSWRFWRDTALPRENLSGEVAVLRPRSDFPLRLVSHPKSLAGNQNSPGASGARQGKYHPDSRLSLGL